MANRTEQMLSDMAAKREQEEADARGVTVEGLRRGRRECAHVWTNRGYYDECDKCGDARA